MSIKDIEHTCDGTNLRLCSCALEYKRRKDRERMRKLRAENPPTYEQRRKENLKRFGLTVEDYEALRVKQDYRCAICFRHENELTKNYGGRPRKDGLPTAKAAPLDVDHCHATGKVRGLLCRRCNLVVALAEEARPAGKLRNFDFLGHLSTYLGREVVLHSE